MKRWLLFFFVLVLPLQLAWSASAVYCQHEDAPGAFHLGHHAHVHKNVPQAKTKALQDTAAAAVQLTHSDCSYCHASVAQLPAGPLGMWEAPYGRSVQSHPPQLYAFRIEPDIERPKWTHAS